MKTKMDKATKEKFAFCETKLEAIRNRDKYVCAYYVLIAKQYPDMPIIKRWGAPENRAEITNKPAQ